MNPKCHAKKVNPDAPGDNFSVANLPTLFGRQHATPLIDYQISPAPGFRRKYTCIIPRTALQCACLFKGI